MLLERHLPSAALIPVGRDLTEAVLRVSPPLPLRLWPAQANVPIRAAAASAPPSLTLKRGTPGAGPLGLEGVFQARNVKNPGSFGGFLFVRVPSPGFCPDTFGKFEKGPEWMNFSPCVWDRRCCGKVSFPLTLLLAPSSLLFWFVYLQLCCGLIWNLLWNTLGWFLQPSRLWSEVHVIISTTGAQGKTPGWQDSLDLLWMCLSLSLQKMFCSRRALQQWCFALFLLCSPVPHYGRPIDALSSRMWVWLSAKLTLGWSFACFHLHGGRAEAGKCVSCAGSCWFARAHLCVYLERSR